MTPDLARLELIRLYADYLHGACYDADLTVAAFASRLKDGVGLNGTQADLATVVRKALEPPTSLRG